MSRRKIIDKFVNLGLSAELYSSLEGEADLRGLSVVDTIRTAIWEMIERRKEKEVRLLERRVRALEAMRRVDSDIERDVKGA